VDLHGAFAKMKAARNKALNFFFYEAGADGKPVLLLDARPIPSKERTEVLKTVKKKGKCGGEMAINPAGELDVMPKWSAPSSLAKGIQIAARSANAMVFSGVNILPEQPE
jgi:hypothetical protein